MTFLRAFWARVALFAIARQEPSTIAERRKAAFTSAGPRYRQTQPADPGKLRGERVRGKVRDIYQWTAKYDRPRRRA